MMSVQPAKTQGQYGCNNLAVSLAHTFKMSNHQLQKIKNYYYSSLDQQYLLPCQPNDLNIFEKWMLIVLCHQEVLVVTRQWLISTAYLTVVKS